MELNEMLERIKTVASGFTAFAREKADEAAAQAKGLADIAKAKLEILGEEEKVKKAELEIGKLFYRDYAVGEELDSAEYLPWCLKIDESNEKITALKQQIEQAKEAQQTKAAPEAPVEAEPAAEADVTEEDFVVVCEDAEAPAEEAPVEETPAEEPKEEAAE